ncbi:unnamed protein product, partial [Iphiclides podalirius]
MHSTIAVGFGASGNGGALRPAKLGHVDAALLRHGTLHASGPIRVATPTQVIGGLWQGSTAPSAVARMGWGSDTTLDASGPIRIAPIQLFEYERVVQILLNGVSDVNQEGFVQRIAIYLLNSLACQVDNTQKRFLGNNGAIGVSSPPPLGASWYAAVGVCRYVAMWINRYAAVAVSW